jgi:hypothetical protein
MNLSQSKMENAQSHVITVTGKIIKVYKLSREHNVTPLPCFWVFFFFFFFSIHKQTTGCISRVNTRSLANGKVFPHSLAVHAVLPNNLPSETRT